MCREGFRGGSKSWARCFSGLRLHKGLGQVTPRAAGCRRGCVVSDAGTCDTRDPAPPEALIRRQSSDGKRVGPLLHGSRSNVAVADQGLGCSTLIHELRARSFAAQSTESVCYLPSNGWSE
jgi:hypothetical protein